MTLLKISLSVLLLTVTSCDAQTMFGLQGGMNWSNYDAKPTPGDVFGTGSAPNFGFLLQSKLLDQLYLVGGLSYVKKTIPWLVHQYLKSASPDIEFQYEFTQISVSLKKEFPIYNIGPYVTAGGSYGFLNSGSYIDGRFGGQAYTMDWTNNYRRNDFDLNFGVGISYDVAQPLLMFAEIKYSYDLVSLNTNTANNTYIRSTQGCFGILFNI